MNKLKIIATTFTFLTLGIGHAAAESPRSSIKAPFGLNWGEMMTDFDNLDDCEDFKSTLTVCDIISPPALISDGRSYWGVFDKQKGLVKAGFSTNYFTNDSYGTEGKNRFDEIKNALLKKYPNAENDELIMMHAELYEDSDEFYECLRYDGCGYHTLFLMADDSSSLSVQINGISRGKGYISVAYESSMFSEVMDKNEELIKKSDIESL